MSHEEALAKVGRLRVVTVDRGATPAEAATAAALAQRLLTQIADRRALATTHASRHFGLAPGVHIEIV